MTTDAEVVLEVKDLTKHFPVTRGIIFSRVVGTVKAVDGVSFTVHKGDTFALVGESGCGKTTTSRVILKLEEPTSGEVLYRGENVHQLSGEGLRKFRTGVQAVFQDPYSSLNPRMKVEATIAEPLAINLGRKNSDEVKRRTHEIYQYVGLDLSTIGAFPRAFSGGQRQRIALARAMVLNPEIIILDEPVSSLDVSIRAQVMNLFKDLQAEFGLTYLLIAHDLATVRYMANRMAVMYLGKIMESGASEDIYENPRHPYTKALLSAALPSHPDIEREAIELRGEVPSAMDPPSGCPFRTRCIYAMDVCAEVEPVLTETTPGHHTACHLVNAP